VEIGAFPKRDGTIKKPDGIIKNWKAYYSAVKSNNVRWRIVSKEPFLELQFRRRVAPNEGL
jgi:hypothetical protein